jgi:transcriptional regulator with XRE-family HTH domain
LIKVPAKRTRRFAGLRSNIKLQTIPGDFDILKPTDYDIRIIQAIRALRELRGVKQKSIGLELDMTESNYNKIEKGYKTMSVSQLKTIAKTLDVSVFMILALAESDRLVDNKIVPLSDILLKFVDKVHTEGILLSAAEVGIVLDKITGTGNEDGSTKPRETFQNGKLKSDEKLRL